MTLMFQDLPGSVQKCRVLYHADVYSAAALSAVRGPVPALTHSQMALVKALLLPCMQARARSGSSWIRRPRFKRKSPALGPGFASLESAKWTASIRKQHLTAKTLCLDMRQTMRKSPTTGTIPICPTSAASLGRLQTRVRPPLLIRHRAYLADLTFLGAEVPVSASFASRAARRRAVFARTATLFASCSRIACAASCARRSFAAAAELGCTFVFEATDINPSPRSRKVIYSTKKPASGFQSQSSGHVSLAPKSGRVPQAHQSHPQAAFARLSTNGPEGACSG